MRQQLLHIADPAEPHGKFELKESTMGYIFHEDEIASSLTNQKDPIFDEIVCAREGLVRFLLQEENLTPYVEGALGRWFPVTKAAQQRPSNVPP